MVFSPTPLPLSCCSFADCLLSMLLYVLATKAATHFSDNDKGYKAYRQETKKSK